VGLLRNPDEIGYAFHWAGIQLGKHGEKPSGVAKAMPDRSVFVETSQDRHVMGKSSGVKK
jgi:hypothetical protein